MILSDQSIKELCTKAMYLGSDDLFYATDYSEPVDSGVESKTLPGGQIRRVTSRITIPKPMIEPFVDHSVKEDEDGMRIISYGLSSYGYDIRLANEFRLFTKPNDGRVIDPKNPDHDEFSESVKADEITIPPGGLLLGRSVERFYIPRECLVVCLGKSTYARVGALVNVTPLEPEWSGELVIEITNGTNLPLKVYANEGIAQLIFHLGDRVCETSYGDRDGKYQNQQGVVGSRV